jgi:hypothetical protein
MEKIIPAQYVAAVQQLFDDAVEGLGLAKECKEADDLSATLAVVLYKLDLAANFIEQHQPGFLKEIGEAKQRVIAAMTPKH